jgi:hypothetical protein
VCGTAQRQRARVETSAGCRSGPGRACNRPNPRADSAPGDVCRPHEGQHPTPPWLEAPRDVRRPHDGKQPTRATSSTPWDVRRPGPAPGRSTAPNSQASRSVARSGSRRNRRPLRARCRRRSPRPGPRRSTAACYSTSIPRILSCPLAFRTPARRAAQLSAAAVQTIRERRLARRMSSTAGGPPSPSRGRKSRWAP